MSENNNELSKFWLYTDDQGDVNVKVLFEGESIWLTQKSMAELFDVDRSVITKHLSNIFEDLELEENQVSAIFAHTAEDGKNYQTKFYNLDAIISVGYRVSSQKATRFRIWATKTLKDFVIKGFVLDDERLKQGKNFGKDYFDELLERIREIRSSERRFYQKITDIYTTSIDYDKDDQKTRDFFAEVQNKLLWAITGKTAPETIYNLADSTKPNMGLTSWKNGPKGKILKSDVSTSKNYLAENHIKELDRLVSAYLDLAESRAIRQIPTSMKDWSKFLENFLKLSDYSILQDKGKIKKEVAKLKAEQEYEKFRPIQDKTFESDFDKIAKQTLEKAKKQDKKD